MNTLTIVGLLIVGLTYLFISQYYLKRKLKIKDKWVLTRNRHAYSFVIEIILFVLFLITFMEIDPTANSYSPITGISLIFTFFFIISIIRGMDEWLRNRDEKVYYHDWLGSIMLVLFFLVIYLGEQY